MDHDAELSVSRQQALGWRLGRHLLDPVGSESVAEVVRRLGAVPSMDESLAELAVRTRRRTSRPGELATALAAGAVVKAFAFRGAVHYLAAEDGGIYLALRAAGRQWELPSWVEHYRLAAEDWPAFRAAVREALADGPLTVGELLAPSPATGPTGTSRRCSRRGGTLVKPLTWQGDMGFGPPREGRATFQRLDTTPRWQGIPDLEDAGPRAVLAYLRTYGPATAENLQHWLGDGLSAGRRRIERWVAGLGERLVTVEVAGAASLLAREDVDGLLAAEPSEAVRLLPGHDQWVMGPGTRDEAVVPPERRDPVTRKNNLVVVGGVVAGTWSRRADDLHVTWLDQRAVPRAALEREVERLAGILGRDLRLRPAGTG